MYGNLFLFITYRDHSTKINKRGGSNKGNGHGGQIFLQNKYPWRHHNLVAQSISDFTEFDQTAIFLKMGTISVIFNLKAKT